MSEQFIHVPSTDTETDPVQDPTGSDSLTGTEQELAALVDTSESSSASEDADVWEDDDHVDEDEEDEDEEDWEDDEEYEEPDWDDSGRAPDVNPYGEPY